ncbi:MAG: ATP-dependent Clp protease ATP-binding subunit ClpC [Candidatus Moranbacteria bacterium CG23_combo_of_CG06-09_8_20_14_all_39_10]|nr:MAG: ATP-dependent Clp protease ATP-binding subunit ClpC [Candidatus Moranbacteria bacterium CG23_combo_of_CG06-09_8_20_14_all_39_10]
MRNSLTILPHQLAGQKLTNHAKQALIESGNLARKFGHAEIDNIHLLYAIYLNQGSLGSNILKDFGVKETDLKKLLEQKRDTNAKNVKKNQLLPSNRLKKTFTSAYAIAKKLNYPFVGTEHMIHAIINSDDAAITNFLSNINLKSTPKSLVALFDPAQLSNIPKIFDIPDISLGKPSGKKSSTTPFISKFCIDINKEVHKKNELIIGREIEIQRMINILGRKNKNNPILVGEAGVGKTALVSGLAHRINSGAVPPALYRKKIMGLDVAQLIAGTSFRGEFETRLKEIIKEASAHRNIIIFIDEIHTIVGAGNLSGGLDLANILKPALARGELQIIGATTFEEYKKYIEKDAALERRFQLIQVEEPSKNEAEKILLGIRKDYEKFHNVSISDEAIKLAVELSVRYIQNRFLPDKAIDVIDEAASNIRSKHRVSDFLYQIGKLEDKKLAFLEEKEKLVGQEDYEKAIKLRSQEKEIEQQIKLLQKKQSAVESDYPVNITAADVIETIAKISKIPVEKLSADSGSKIKNIKKVLNSQIVGQKEAIEKLASALLRSQSGVSNPDRPLGSFLFLGPTGVGKTMTAKVLAQEFFDNPKALIRIDMSELMERHNVASLIGSPAGYIGYGEGGKLTEKVRRNPYSVILFDEIEKAHPDVFNILLQILEDGNLTDAEGLRVDFKNTIVILTSNIGTADFTNASKLGFESTDKNSAVSKKFNEIKDHTIKELEKRMRPELLNRLDHILVFNSLGEAEIKKITKKELKKLADRLAKQKISLAFNAAAINFIAKKSLAWNQGARLIRKNIQELLENPISEIIIYNRVKNGKISANVKNNSIKLI